jgi:penicillin amidase
MMRSWLQSAIGLTITAIVLAGCFVLFAVLLATRSHPVPYQEEQATVGDTVRIYRNSFGIPHVVGTSLEDVVFAQGVAHAQDRLWQMDVWRRVGRGTLAEVLGSEAVAVDAFMRTIDIAGIARQNIRSIDGRTRRLLEEYSRGINTFIERNLEDLPFEFDALGYTPAPWTPEDCLVVGRALAFEVSLAFWSDLVFAQIALKRGRGAEKLFIPRSDIGPYVLDSSMRKADTGFVTGRSISAAQSNSASGNGDELHHSQHLLSSLRAVRERLGMQGSGFGSNCWAVRGEDGSASLANDPHLSVSMPPKWYQIHMSAPGFNVVGMSLPGIPFVLSGRNDHVAWGFTNTMIDDVDYVLERVDPKNSNYYFDGNGGRVKFRYRRDTIKIRDRADSLIDLRFTNRSCVVSDYHLLRTPSVITKTPRTMSTTILNSSCLTMRWTARYRSDEITALFKINRSTSVNDVVAAVATWGAPTLTFSVAAKNGSIGTVIAGYVPRRGSADPHLPIPTDVQGADWSGVVSSRSLGLLMNPSRGFVASANNAIAPNPPMFIGSIYEPPSRIQRIHELLSIYRSPNARDHQVMQLDIVSPYARAMCSRLVPILRRGASRYGDIEQRALKVLARWDGTQTSLDPASTIYAVFLQRMLWNTFKDELGEQLYYDWSLVSNLPLRKLDEMINDPSAVVWDDVSTAQREDLAWITIRSFIEAVAELRERFDNEDIPTWTYGRVHTVTFPHLFGDHPLMRPVMNQGPFEVSGSQTTVQATEWSIGNPYATRVAASMRVVSMMRDSIQYSVVPGGASGQPLSAHYADQLQLWLKGGYVRIPVGASPDISFRLFHVFVP